MKIQAIRICGFRGIPPKRPPNVDILLGDPNAEPGNMVLYGPNAYGKSSIADAIEWFFKERARGAEYFDEYRDSDTVHLNLGKPNYEDRASIELDVWHNGQTFRLSKELDASGHKCSENLGALVTELRQASDEIIVLDHDKFRKFVQAANREKWATFAGLIGFEDLDSFRAGLDSLTGGNSLTANLGVRQLEQDVQRQRRDLQTALAQALRRHEVETQPGRDELDSLRAAWFDKLEITAHSLGVDLPATPAEVSEDVWQRLRDAAKPADSYAQGQARVAALNGLSGALAPFDNQFDTLLDELGTAAGRLDMRKADFDREVLSEFYRKGLQVLDEGKSEKDVCPLCQTPYDWLALRASVNARSQGLDFDKIRTEHSDLRRTWSNLRATLSGRWRGLVDSEVDEVVAACRTLPSDDDIDRAVTLATFDADLVQKWVDACRAMLTVVADKRKLVIAERDAVQIGLGTDPRAQLSATLTNLESTWQSWRDLTQSSVRLQQSEGRLNATNQVKDSLQAVARAFRDELSDFSARVVGVINKDVDAYYAVLHPDDKVKPYLETEIQGTQRIVRLKCSYKGMPGRDAPSLLSESHRNSLGMAILLAFMNYKRRNGSPVEFCVFDDVTQSFDLNHRASLLTLLEHPDYPEVSEQQILFLTHDRTLADLIKRPGESDVRLDWKRLDIKHWWLEGMSFDPCNDPLSKAKQHLDQQDEIAAAIYARRALEQLYKKIVGDTGIRVGYKSDSRKYDLGDFRSYILQEIRGLWDTGEGFINPADINFDRPMTAQQILNLTVHDSDFLDSPMQLEDVEGAIKMIDQLRQRFSCSACGTFYHTVKKDRQGNPPRCRKSDCAQPLV